MHSILYERIKQGKTMHSPSKNKQYSEWKEFLKNDWDYDYHFILMVLKYKLERTRKCMARNKIRSDYKDIVKEIQSVEALLAKVIKDQYEKTELLKLEKKFGVRRLKVQTNKQTRTAEISSNWDKLPLAKQKQANKELHQANKLALKKKKEDLKKAFSIMSNKIWDWWD